METSLAGENVSWHQLLLLQGNQQCLWCKFALHLSSLAWHVEGRMSDAWTLQFGKACIGSCNHTSHAFMSNNSAGESDMSLPQLRYVWASILARRYWVLANFVPWGMWGSEHSGLTDYVVPAMFVQDRLCRRGISNAAYGFLCYKLLVRSNSNAAWLDLVSTHIAWGKLLRVCITAAFHCPPQLKFTALIYQPVRTVSISGLKVSIKAGLYIMKDKNCVCLCTSTLAAIVVEWWHTLHPRLCLVMFREILGRQACWKASNSVCNA